MDEVLERIPAGELRKSLGVSKQTISDWKRVGHVSAKRAPAVERLTGIPRERLCPVFDWSGEAHQTHATPTAPLAE